jgi:hypothetical protein
MEEQMDEEDHMDTHTGMEEDMNNERLRSVNGRSFSGRNVYDRIFISKRRSIHGWSVWIQKEKYMDMEIEVTDIGNRDK